MSYFIDDILRMGRIYIYITLELHSFLVISHRDLSRTHTINNNSKNEGGGGGGGGGGHFS